MKSIRKILLSELSFNCEQQLGTSGTCEGCLCHGWSWATDGSDSSKRYSFSPSSLLDIHAVRPHRGQGEVAFRFRSLLDSDHHPSEIAGLGVFLWVSLSGFGFCGKNDNTFSAILTTTSAESHRFCDRVQDAYTLRCCPQVNKQFIFFPPNQQRI